MLTITSGEDATIAVPFERDGEPFLADANTTTWTLRGHDGAVLSGPTNFVPDDTYALITVPAIRNSVSSGRRFEKRFVVVRGETGGQPFEAQTAYRVSPFLNITANKDAVRSFVGANANELADNEIDLADAYFQIADLLTPEVLITALESGTIAEQIANQAIVARAVLNCLPGLRQRMLKSQSDGTMSASRFTVDFDRLEQIATAAIGRSVTGLSSDGGVERTLFMVSTPTDPITGS